MERTMGTLIEKEIQGITESILQDYSCGRAIDKMDDLFNQPDKETIIEIVDNLVKVVFPGYYRDKSYKIYHAESNLTLIIEDVMYHLHKQIEIALKFNPAAKAAEAFNFDRKAQEIAVAFMKKVPKIRAYLNTDLQAALDGDPAAGSKDEIILAYPGLFAITVNRIAHELYLLSVPLIPRIMTEYAHSVTGIDIHPGATLGKYFFIDHGTGIVIGETTVIGDNVKVYQGVTLGALSTRGGQRLRGTKRHPTIEDNVTIYAGASILGGETVIGKNAVIGSNAFITKSIEEETRVSIKNQELQLKGLKQEIGGKEGPEPWFYTI